MSQSELHSRAASRPEQLQLHIIPGERQKPQSSKTTHVVVPLFEDQVCAIVNGTGTQYDPKNPLPTWDLIGTAVSRALFNDQILLRPSFLSSMRIHQTIYVLLERSDCSSIDPANLKVLDLRFNKKLSDMTWDCQIIPAVPEIHNHVKKYVQNQQRDAEYWEKVFEDLEPDPQRMIEYFNKALDLAYATGVNPFKLRSKYKGNDVDPGIMKLFNEGLLYRPEDFSTPELLVDRFKQLLSDKATSWDDMAHSLDNSSQTEIQGSQD